MLKLTLSLMALSLLLLSSCVGVEDSAMKKTPHIDKIVIAASKGRLGTVIKLLNKHKIDINQRSSAGETALIGAIKLLCG